jgi:hypothetical protein
MLDHSNTECMGHFGDQTDEARIRADVKRAFKKAFLEEKPKLASETFANINSGEGSEEVAPGKVNARAELNKDFAIVRYGNDAVIADISMPEITFMGLAAFHALHASTFMATTGPDGVPSRKPVTKSWFTWKGRREYKNPGVAFEPTQPLEIPGKMLNLWRGFAVEPKQGNCSLLWAHIHDVVCCSNVEHFEYLRNWMAACVQWLDDPVPVVLLLRGTHGAGKGVACRTIVQLFGQHGSHVFNADQITGKFNSIIADKLPVFLDEAMFAGDRKAANMFKGLVTEPMVPIERKGIDTIMVKNRTRHMIASNSPLPAHIEVRDRRYFVLDCSDKYARDLNDPSEVAARKVAYWTALFEGGKSGAVAVAMKQAFLYDLQHIDLSDFDVFAIPQTAAKIDLIEQGLPSTAAWLRQAFRDGKIGLAHSWEELGIDIDKDDAYVDYEIFSKKRREYSPVLKSVWARDLYKIMGGAAKPIRPRDGSKERPRLIHFAPLALCQEHFARYMRASQGMVDWDD